MTKRMLRIPDKIYCEMLEYVFELEDNLYGEYVAEYCNEAHYRCIYNKEYVKYKINKDEKI